MLTDPISDYLNRIRNALLADHEEVEIPADEAAEMTAIDPGVGEFRAHYAGFFDPGFGAADAGGAGSRAVLEVRSREAPFLIEDGQPVEFGEPLVAIE